MSLQGSEYNVKYYLHSRKYCLQFNSRRNIQQWILTDTIPGHTLDSDRNMHDNRCDYIALVRDNYRKENKANVYSYDDIHVDEECQAEEAEVETLS